MTEISRTQFVVAALVVVVVVVLGGHALGAGASSSGSSLAGAPSTPADGAAGSSRSTAGAYKEIDADAGAAASGVSVTPPQAAPQASPVVVQVTGDVRRPGVYSLKAGARVEEAITRAGGLRRGAAVEAVNLAAKATDGQQIVVPRRAHGKRTIPVATAAAAAGGAAEGAAVDGGSAAAAAPAAPVDLNTASLEQLETLDGVGPATAQKILDYRVQHGSFRSVDDLDEVSGIGPKKLAALRPHVHT